MCFTPLKRQCSFYTLPLTLHFELNGTTYEMGLNILLKITTVPLSGMPCFTEYVFAF